MNNMNKINNIAIMNESAKNPVTTHTHNPCAALNKKTKKE